MNKDELLTVAEVAERCGKSKQAIYRRLSTSLQPFVQVLNGQKYLHINALKVLDSTPLFNVEQPLNNDSINVEQPLIGVLKEQLDLLQRQLDVKDKQIEVKDKQIEELNNRLKEALERSKESNYLLARNKLIEGSEKPLSLPLHKRLFSLFKSKPASEIEE